MKSLDTIVTALGIVYGLMLIVATFVRSAFAEAIRIDALFMPNPTDASRPLNLVIGLLIIGYMLYSLF